MNDKYNNFDNEQFNYHYPINFKCRPLNYMKGDLLATYEMSYGDTARLAFQVDTEYFEHSISIQIYNFRYEQLLVFETIPDLLGKVFFDIDAKTSIEVFKKGIYYCRIQALTYLLIIGAEAKILTCATILEPENCSILVK